MRFVRNNSYYPLVVSAPRRMVLPILLSVFVIGCACDKARAQAEKVSLDQSFKYMMADLSDPERAFRYAKLAIEAGATADAVAALERVLLANPRLDNIRFELGLLYAALGNNVLARTYIEPALLSPEIPPSSRERAERALSESKIAASPHRFYSSAYFGMRYDSNVNAAPGNGQVLITDQIYTLTPQSRSKSDGSVLGNVSTRYTYDLGWQDSSRLEFNSTGSFQRYFERKDYDNAVLTGDFGPWLGLGGILSSSTEVRPYVTGTYLTLENRKYLTQAGGGVAVRHLVTRDLELSASVQDVHQTFFDSPRRRFASLQTGNELRVTTGLRYAIVKDQVLGLELAFSDRSARARWEERSMIAVGASYSVQYADPTGFIGKPWQSALSAVYRFYDYKGLDLDISALRQRADRRTEVSFTQSIGLNDSASLVITADYALNNSNLPNYKYDSFGISAGIRAAF